jgi:uncharacterized membrane protein
MKIIGISRRRDWDNYEYVCTVSSNEIAALLDINYRESFRLEVGTELKVEALSERLKEIRSTKELLRTTPKRLRELADVLDRECVAIVLPTAEKPKE